MTHLVSQKASVVDELFYNAGLLIPQEDRSHGLRVRVLRIGPCEAKALLVANKDNRALRPGRVRYYAKTMLEGNWMLTHQGIAFDKDGTGVDLQHRLNAIIKSGVTVRMMVVEGLDPLAFKAIDQHERRSISDTLRVNKRLAEEARLFIRVAGGDMATNPTIAATSDMCEMIEDLSVMLRHTSNSNRKVVASAAMRCAAILLMIEQPENTAKICELYRIISTLDSHKYTDLMHVFSRMVQDGKVRSVSPDERYDLFARALIILDPKCADRRKFSFYASNAAVLAHLRKRVKSVFGNDYDVVEMAEAA